MMTALRSPASTMVFESSVNWAEGNAVIKP